MLAEHNDADPRPWFKPPMRSCVCARARLRAASVPSLLEPIAGHTAAPGWRIQQASCPHPDLAELIAPTVPPRGAPRGRQRQSTGRGAEDAAPGLPLPRPLARFCLLALLVTACANRVAGNVWEFDRLYKSPPGGLTVFDWTSRLDPLSELTGGRCAARAHTVAECLCFYRLCAQVRPRVSRFAWCAGSSSARSNS
jgi:hypothetical protein